jgi:predicted PurR-regulated permease PerM
MTAIYFNPRTKLFIIWALIGLALVFLYAVRAILPPFIAALITAYLLNPVVTWMARRTRLPRRLWAGIIYFALLGGLFWGLSQLVPSLAVQVEDLAQALPGYLQQIDDWLKGNRIEVAGINIDMNQVSAEAVRNLGALANDLGRGAPEFALSVFERLFETIIYLVSTFFFLQQAEPIVNGIRAQFPDDVLTELDPWIRRINATLAAYVRGQAILIVYMIVATFVALSLLDVHYALALAVMTGLVELIPFLGPYMAGGIAVLLAMTQGGNSWGWSPVVLGATVIIIYTVLRQVQDNIIGPLVIGRVIDLHPLAVIFVVLAGAALAGLMGLLLAIPLAASLRIVFQFLFQKLRQEGPRAIVPVSATATWEDIAHELRGLHTERAVLVAPAAPAALHDPATFRLMSIVAHEAELKLTLMTDDPTARALAEQFGIETMALPTDLHPAAIVAAGQPPRPSTPAPAPAEALAVPSEVSARR